MMQDGTGSAPSGLPASSPAFNLALAQAAAAAAAVAGGHHNVPGMPGLPGLGLAGQPAARPPAFAAARPPGLPNLAGLPPAALAALAAALPGLGAGTGGQLNPQLAQILAMAAAGAAGVGAGAAPPAVAAKPAFNLQEILGDTSHGISEEQALTLQKAIRSLKDPSLAGNLMALAQMPPAQLKTLLTTQNINMKDVLAKLEPHIDPARARELFGDGYTYAVPKPPAIPPALLAQLAAGGPSNPAMAAALAMAAQRPPAPPAAPAVPAAPAPNLPAALAAAMARTGQLGNPAALQLLLTQAGGAGAAATLLQTQLAAAGKLAGQAGGAVAAPAAGASTGSAAAPAPSGPLEHPHKTLRRLQPSSVKYAIVEMLMKGGPKVSDMGVVLGVLPLGLCQNHPVACTMHSKAA